MAWFAWVLGSHALSKHANNRYKHDLLAHIASFISRLELPALEKSRLSSFTGDMHKQLLAGVIRTDSY